MRQGEAESEILIGGCAVKNSAVSKSAMSVEVAMRWNDEFRQFDSPVRLLSAGDLNHLSGLTFKRLHQPADIRPDFDLVPRQLANRSRSPLAKRRQVTSLHVTASRVVIVDPL